MELLITVLTLLAAIYAVVPRERQLDLRVRVRPLDLLVIALGSLVVLYLEFFDFVEAHGWVLKYRHWPEGITPKNTIYLVMLGVAGFVALRIRFAHLTKSNIHKFRELALELYWSASYAELFAIIQKHLRELFRLYDSDFVLARIRARLTPSVWLIGDQFDVFLSGGGHVAKHKRKRKIIPSWLIRF